MKNDLLQSAVKSACRRFFMRKKTQQTLNLLCIKD